VITIGEGTVVEDTAIILDGVTIGRDCYIGHHAIIGADPQQRGYYPSPIDGDVMTKDVWIGNGVCIREQVQVHRGVRDVTMIRGGSLIMAGVHVAHDVLVGYGCTIGSFSVFGGHTTVADDVTFGQGVVTHPWIVIGEGAMIGLNSSVIKDVKPYQKVAGNPARLLGHNTGASGDVREWDWNTLDGDTWDEYNEMLHRRDETRKLSKEGK